MAQMGLPNDAVHEPTSLALEMKKGGWEFFFLEVKNRETSFQLEEKKNQRT